MNWRRFYAVLVPRNREFLRDHSALAWNILFPALLVIGFGFAFSGDTTGLYRIGAYAGGNVTTTEQRLHDLQQQPGFFSLRYLTLVPVTDLAQALTKVERHQLDMLFDLQTGRYWINSDSPNGYILEHVLYGADQAGNPQSGFTRGTVSGREVRYVDWVIPGVLGMNMMFSGLFGVGYVIVRYRKSGVLKRLHATPLTAFEFLSAQVVSRLWLILAITIGVYIGGDYFIDFTMHGSYWHLLLVAMLGAISMISLGLLIAARVTSEELAGGILNLLSWPMMFLSGVWFSLEGLQPWIQHLAQIFPLTHIISAARAIMIDGASLAGIFPDILTLTLMSAAFLLLGAWQFRWEAP